MNNTVSILSIVLNNNVVVKLYVINFLNISVILDGINHIYYTEIS